MCTCPENVARYRVNKRALGRDSTGLRSGTVFLCQSKSPGVIREFSATAAEKNSPMSLNQVDLAFREGLKWHRDV